MKDRAKFRAWDPLTKKMIAEGYHVIGEVTLMDVIEQYVYEHPDGDRPALERMGDIVEMQWTGLRDKDGKEIYEADVVEVEYGRGKVVFNAGCFMIEWIDDPEANMELLSVKDFKRGHLRTDLVVLGNIHSNPELLSPTP